MYDAIKINLDNLFLDNSKPLDIIDARRIYSITLSEAHRAI